jgi:hypothetical protein
MPSPALALPETDQPRCPSCRSHRIAPVGHVLAAGGLIKSEQRCEVCGTVFFLVRKAFT